MHEPFIRCTGNQKYLTSHSWDITLTVTNFLLNVTHCLLPACSLIIVLTFEWESRYTIAALRLLIMLLWVLCSIPTYYLTQIKWQCGSYIIPSSFVISFLKQPDQGLLFGVCSDLCVYLPLFIYMFFYEYFFLRIHYNPRDDLQKRKLRNHFITFQVVRSWKI